MVYFQIFGAKVFVMDKNPEKGKFESRSEEGIFVCYSSESKAFRVWVPRLRRVISSRDLKFMNETAFDREYQEFFNENEEAVEPEPPAKITNKDEEIIEPELPAEITNENN